MEYKAAKLQMDSFLGRVKAMFLATANSKGVPSLRQMSVIYLNGKLYFQTSENFEKTSEISGNPNVALGIGNYSLNGVAKILGRPNDKPAVMEVFKVQHPEAYKNYSSLPDEILIEVEPTRCKIWNGHDVEYDGRETITTIDLIHHTTSHIFCK